MTHNWAESLARTLKLAREMKQLTTSAHAELIGISPTGLSRIESGKKCDVDTLLKIHAATGITLNTLLGIGEQKSKA